MRHTDFELTSGGVIGRDHRKTHGNYQDAFTVYRDSNCTVAVVADGCGSSPHSEAGAQLGVRLLAEAVAREVRRRDTGDINWQRVLNDLVSALNDLALQMGGDFRQTLNDYFLFTLIGVLLAGDTATFFTLGDGAIIVDGQVYEIGPFPGNQPPYAAYNLMGRPFEITVSEQSRLDEIGNFLIGSDGVMELIAAEEKCLPGLDEPVGPLAQFWQDDRYYSGNPDLVSRRLRLVGRDWPKQNPHPGLLRDDTTLIAGRRRKAQT